MIPERKDKVLKQLNKSIAKEKEKESILPSTIYFYRAAVVICIAIATLCMIQTGIFTYENVKLTNEITNLKQELSAANETIKDYKDIVSGLQQEILVKDDSVEFLSKRLIAANNSIDTLVDQRDSLISEMGNIVNQYNILQNEYLILSEREELFDKYEYALFNTRGNRTDLTYDMCAYAENLMINNGMDPDLLFSIGMVESEYTENAKNKDSTATGFHQFLKGTGEWVYGKLGYTDKYNHTEIQTDGYKSLECGAWYLSYLCKKHDGDLIKAISEYRGVWNPISYMNKMNTYLATKNKSIESIQESQNDTLTLFNSTN